MNDKSKLNKYFQALKKMWNNKKYRSLFILFLYVIFFTIIFILLFLGKENVEINYESKDSFENYDTYEFSVKININESIYDISGKRYNDQYQFNYNGQIYDMNFFEIKNSDLDKNIINSFEYTPDFISNLVKNSKLISEKKVIEDGRIIKEYSLELDNYLLQIDYNLTNYDNNDAIVIVVDEIDDQVIKVELDLTNFYKYIDNVYQKYKIEINYSDLDNDTNF